MATLAVMGVDSAAKGSEKTDRNAKTRKGISNAEALSHYLSIISEDPASWTKQSNKLVAKANESETDTDGKLILLVHSIRIVASGRNAAANADKYAFMIENAYTEQPDTPYPAHDRYTCEVLVLTVGSEGWNTENLDLVGEFLYEGGTRFAKDCSGYKISWKNKSPVFTREVKYGPYAGGQYETVMVKISRKNGKYEAQ